MHLLHASWSIWADDPKTKHILHSKQQHCKRAQRFFFLSFTLSLSCLFYWVTKACVGRACAACCKDWCWTFSPFKLVGGLDNTVPEELLATLPSLFKCVCYGRHSLSSKLTVILALQSDIPEQNPTWAIYCISILTLTSLSILFCFSLLCC